MPTFRILFLCTGNSARSIIAEALSNARFGHRLTACSAGSTPSGTVSRLAIETLHDHGVATDGLASKSWDVYAGETFDLVVTLCASAASETCPAFPGAPARVHWGFPDPPTAPDPRAAFRCVFDGLCEAIEVFTTNVDDGVEAAAELAAAHVRRLTGAGL